MKNWTDHAKKHLFKPIDAVVEVTQLDNADKLSVKKRFYIGEAIVQFVFGRDLPTARKSNVRNHSIAFL